MRPGPLRQQGGTRIRTPRHLGPRRSVAARAGRVVRRPSCETRRHANPLARRRSAGIGRRYARRFAAPRAPEADSVRSDRRLPQQHETFDHLVAPLTLARVTSLTQIRGIWIVRPNPRLDASVLRLQPGSSRPTTLSIVKWQPAPDCAAPSVVRARIPL